MQREREKKRKAEEKRQRRLLRKQQSTLESSSTGTDSGNANHEGIDPLDADESSKDPAPDVSGKENSI